MNHDLGVTNVRVHQVKIGLNQGITKGIRKENNETSIVTTSVLWRK